MSGNDRRQRGARLRSSSAGTASGSGVPSIDRELPGPSPQQLEEARTCLEWMRRAKLIAGKTVAVHPKVIAFALSCIRDPPAGHGGLARRMEAFGVEQWNELRKWAVDAERGRIRQWLASLPTQGERGGGMALDVDCRRVSVGYLRAGSVCWYTGVAGLEPHPGKLLPRGGSTPPSQYIPSHPRDPAPTLRLPPLPGGLAHSPDTWLTPTPKVAGGGLVVEWDTHQVSTKLKRRASQTLTRVGMGQPRPNACGAATLQPVCSRRRAGRRGGKGASATGAGSTPTGAAQQQRQPTAYELPRCTPCLGKSDNKHLEKFCPGRPFEPSSSPINTYYVFSHTRVLRNSGIKKLCQGNFGEN